MKNLLILSDGLIQNKIEKNFKLIFAGLGLYDLSASSNLIGKINHNISNNQIKKYKKISNTHKVSKGTHHAKLFNLDLKNTIKYEIKKSIKDYKYVTFGTETLFLDQIINDLFKKIK